VLDERHFKSKTIRSWSGLTRFFEHLAGTGAQWIFRGQENNEWGLQTTLERAILDFGLSESSGSKRSKEDQDKARRRVLAKGLDGCNVAKIERRLLREFKRRYHHFAQYIPDAGNVPEWLALMRHYGAPTRLLDFSYSPYVATFFALEKERTSKEPEVWAIDSDWADKRVRSVLPKGAQVRLRNDPLVKTEATFRAVFGRSEPIRLVLPVNPYRLNERLVIQQGIFLCPGDVAVPFVDNLAAICEGATSPQERVIRVRFPIDLETRRDMLSRLYRMNMNRATLFPGLDGFAQSLRGYLVFARLFRKSRDFAYGRS